jgi:hypothetical protein
MSEEAQPPTDFRELVHRAITGLRLPPRSKRHGYCYLWSKVGQRFSLGSTSAWKLCVELGFDPNERVKA